MAILPFDEPGDELESVTVHYFIDEAGQPTLFRRRRESMVGQDGCSTYFILGKLDIDDAQALAGDLGHLRHELLTDPYFKGVPSMQSDEGKTAVMFHAKDDLPEVRFQVFRLLMKHPMTFYAVIRNKHRVVAQVLKRNQSDPAYRYNGNELYDDLVAHLFKNRFYKGDHFNICFARRGNSDRTAALEEALARARNTYEESLGYPPRTTTRIWASTPKQEAGLQAVDYFLWALQRLYERGEDRFWEVVRSRIGLVSDMDDTRSAPWGVHYTQNNPLTLDRILRA